MDFHWPLHIYAGKIEKFAAPVEKFYNFFCFFDQMAV